MVQALICANDWLKARGLPCVDVEETLKDLEEMEKGNAFNSFYLFIFTITPNSSFLSLFIYIFLDE